MNNKIYLEDVDSLMEFELPENTYATEEMTDNIFNNLYDKLEYLFGNQKELIEMAKGTIISYCKLGKTYVLIKFKEYYGIVQIIDDFAPREISDEIKCFDKDRPYPLQRIQKVIDWVY